MTTAQPLPPDGINETRTPSAKRDFSFASWSALPTFEVLREPCPSSRPVCLMERALAAVGLAAISPVMALIAVAVKLDSPGGPVFFRQERVGLDRRGAGGEDSDGNTDYRGPERRQHPNPGSVFDVIKFRTMVPDAEKLSGPVWASENDPRITRVGRFLRYARLDELPQLINVVRGEMRLIGPRPERPYFVSKLAEEIPAYTRRLKVPPGITGLAQVERDYDETVDDVRTKVKYDLYYADNRSLKLDTKIIIKTFDVVFRGRGAR